MRVGSRAHFTTPPAPVCVVCQVTATTMLVPTRATRRDRQSGKPIRVTTMRLCAACRHEVVSGRIKLGWSWLDGGWGILGTKSPAGDKYLRHDP
jgi:hypothetical protein